MVVIGSGHGNIVGGIGHRDHDLPCWKWEMHGCHCYGWLTRAGRVDIGFQRRSQHQGCRWEYFCHLDVVCSVCWPWIAPWKGVAIVNRWGQGHPRTLSLIPLHFCPHILAMSPPPYLNHLHASHCHRHPCGWITLLLLHPSSWCEMAIGMESLGKRDTLDMHKCHA